MATAGPVLALLPFATAGGEDEALIAQGLLEDVGAELARFRALQVVSWMSSLEVANLPGREAGARLGATHLLRGRLRRAGDRLRITASLDAAATGAIERSCRRMSRQPALVSTASCTVYRPGVR
jgi:TolB-like protein